jgi:hypothetical protein
LGESRIVRCHVCDGHGTVPFAPRDPQEKVRGEIVRKVYQKAQQELF